MTEAISTTAKSERPAAAPAEKPKKGFLAVEIRDLKDVLVGELAQRGDWIVANVETKLPSRAQAGALVSSGWDGGRNFIQANGLRDSRCGTQHSVGVAGPRLTKHASLLRAGAPAPW